MCAVSMSRERADDDMKKAIVCILLALTPLAVCSCGIWERHGERAETAVRGAGMPEAEISCPECGGGMKISIACGGDGSGAEVDINITVGG